MRSLGREKTVCKEKQLEVMNKASNAERCLNNA